MINIFVDSADNMSYREEIIFFTLCLLVHLDNSKDLAGVDIKSTIHHVMSGMVTMETIHAADKNVYNAHETDDPYRTAYSTIVTKNKELDYLTAAIYGNLRLNCRLPTLRIVRGFVLCQTKPEIQTSYRELELVKINLKSKVINKRRTLRQSKRKWHTDDINIMVEENGIWILYQGYNDGILEKVSLNDLSPIKQINIDSKYTNHHAIIVSSKLYIMSTSNGNLNIIKAIDTENTENKISYKVILSENFPENSSMHYNPKLQQLFVTVTEQTTYIYNVKYCQFSYPSSKTIDLSKIKSTFIWSLIPFENGHYIDIIHSISTFFDIEDHNTLRYIGDILITCPYGKCLMPGMSNKLFCRLNTIRLLFETFVKQKTNPSVFNILQIQLDMLKRLEQSQFRILSNELNALKHMLTKEFLDLKRHMHYFQSKLGSYFLSLAEFDYRKYQSDIELIHNIFNELNTKQEIISPLIMTKLSTLLKQASDTTYVEIAGQISKVLIASAALVNPFSIFDASGVLLEVRDRQAQLTKSVVDKIKLEVISKYIPRLKAIGDQLQPKIKAMTNKFPSIRALISKAMRENLSDKDLNQYSHAFLNEYNSYRPAFEISTVNEYESILTEIIEELCRIIYSGSSLPAAIAQGVLASEGACLATKLDVKNLMGLYRDIYNKQDSLFYALVSAVRATIARQNSINFQDISGRITRGQFENSIINYKMATLEIIVHSEFSLLFLINEACTLLEYKNGGVMSEYCDRDINDPLAVLNNNVVISSRFDKDMCENDNIERYVYIPAQQQSTTSKMPQGTIDLTRLYQGYEVDFEIPSKEWLIENNWIFNYEKDKMIVLQKIELFIPNNNTNSSVDVLSSTRYLSHNKIRPGGKVYEFSTNSIYQYDFRYRQGGEHCTSLNLLRTTPYEFRLCPKLPTICVLSEGKVKNQAAYPSIYSKFGIKLSFYGELKEPKPKTNFFLMAYVKLCIVNPIIPQGKEKNPNSKLNLKRHNVQKSNRNRATVCCGMVNQYYDRLSNSQKCKPCPNGSTPTLGGYYCE